MACVIDVSVGIVSCRVSSLHFNQLWVCVTMSIYSKRSFFDEGQELHLFVDTGYMFRMQLEVMLG